MQKADQNEAGINEIKKKINENTNNNNITNKIHQDQKLNDQLNVETKKNKPQTLLTNNVLISQKKVHAPKPLIYPQPENSIKQEVF